jgi:hypothetical protein
VTIKYVISVPSMCIMRFYPMLVSQIAEKLKGASDKLMESLAEASSSHEVQEEYLSFNLDDLGWK